MTKSLPMPSIFPNWSLTFVGQPSFASSTNIINGNYSQRSEWTVALAAQK